MKPEARPSLIVNADDLGIHPAVNDGIRDAFVNGIVTSATLLINMPHALQAIAEVVRPTGLPVGVHLNVTAGRPVSSPLAVPDLVDERGLFRRDAGDYFRMAVKGGLSPGLLGQVRTEWDAQLALARAELPDPTHIDSHQHLHMIPALFEVAVEVARRHGIRRIRFAREPLSLRLLAIRPGDILRNRNHLKWMVVRWLARKIRNPLASPRNFFGLLHSGGVTEDVLTRLVETIRPGDAPWEVCIHPARPLRPDEPALPELGESWTFVTSPFRALERDALLSPALRRRIEERGIRLIAFDRLEAGA